MSLLNRIFRKSKADVVEFKESHYCAVINDQMQWFDSKDLMLDGIKEYSKHNVIYSLSMFRYDLFNLIN